MLTPAPPPLSTRLLLADDVDVLLALLVEEACFVLAAATASLDLATVDVAAPEELCADAFLLTGSIELSTVRLDWCEETALIDILGNLQYDPSRLSISSAMVRNSTRSKILLALVQYWRKRE
jgi:hypothetical protein